MQGHNFGFGPACDAYLGEDNGDFYLLTAALFVLREMVRATSPSQALLRNVFEQVISRWQVLGLAITQE